MSSSLRIICLVAGTAALVAGPSPAANPSVARLIHEVEQLAAIRDSIQREQLEWDIEKETMRHGILLLEEEKSRLQHLLEAQRKTASEKSEEERNRKQGVLEQERSLHQAEHGLDQYAARIDAARKLFPNLFQEPPRTALGDRLNRLFSAAIAVQREHQSILYTREVMTLPDASRRQMELLRLGHSQTYAVSPDDRVAAHGVWTGSQWEWTWDASMASQIRKAVRVHQGDITPRWVFLPVAVLEKGSP